MEWGGDSGRGAEGCDLMGIPEYRIETVADLLKVPVERRPEMLLDLHCWMNLMETRSYELSIDEGETYPLQMQPVFIWLDDGIRDVQRIYVGDHCFKLADEPIPYKLTDDDLEVL